jgi:general secretion pathway protein G
MTPVQGLIAAAVSLGLIAGNREEIEKFFNDLVAETQKITTAGDLRTISNMLDYHYMRKGRYPSEEAFGGWLAETMKESPIREVSNDNWGNPFIYTTSHNNKRFVLRSAGKDGVAENEDDMTISGP